MSAEMTVGEVSTPTQQSALAACVARGRGGVALLRRRAWLALGVGLTLALALAAVPAAAQPADTDGDGLFDEDEVAIGTDPNLYDTDGDGFGDNHEYFTGTDPLDPASVPQGQPGAALDDDGDMLSNGEEWDLGTDPNLYDTDGDGIGDFGEVGFEPGSSTGTDPLDFDSDDDGYGDGEEWYGGSDPTDAGSIPVAEAPTQSPAQPVGVLPNTGAGPGADPTAGAGWILPTALAAAGLLWIRALAGWRRA